MATKGVLTNEPASMIGSMQKRKKAAELRLQGLRWDQVAEGAGYATGSAACAAVREALKDAFSEMSASVNEYRLVELARLEELIRAHWSAAVSGEDLKAAEVVLKIIDRIARLTGTEQPVKVDVSGGITYEVVGWQPPKIKATEIPLRGTAPGWTPPKLRENPPEIEK